MSLEKFTGERIILKCKTKFYLAVKVIQEDGIPKIYIFKAKDEDVVNSDLQSFVSECSASKLEQVKLESMFPGYKFEVEQRKFFKLLTNAANEVLEFDKNVEIVRQFVNSIHNSLELKQDLLLLLANPVKYFNEKCFTQIGQTQDHQISEAQSRIPRTRILTTLTGLLGFDIITDGDDVCTSGSSGTLPTPEFSVTPGAATLGASVTSGTAAATLGGSVTPGAAAILKPADLATTAPPPNDG